MTNHTEQNTTTEPTTIALNDKITLDSITLDPEIQMREEVDTETINQYADVIDQLPPVTVVAVATDSGEKLYLVDGFHRYRAHQQQERTEIAAKVLQGTYDQAFDMAMTINYKNGRRPTSGDQRRSVTKLAEHYREHFGLNSKSIVPFLVAKGIAKRTAERYTGRYTIDGETVEGIRVQIDMERDERIRTLHAYGRGASEIAKETGVNRTTILGILDKCQNTPEAESDSSTPAGGHGGAEAVVGAESLVEDLPKRTESNVIPITKHDHQRPSAKDAIALTIRLAQAIAELSPKQFMDELDRNDHQLAHFTDLLGFMRDVDAARLADTSVIDNDDDQPLTHSA